MTYRRTPLSDITLSLPLPSLKHLLQFELARDGLRLVDCPQSKGAVGKPICPRASTRKYVKIIFR